MLIANPLYDTVFKYLLEDIDIARELLSLLLDTPILQLTIMPQESTSEVWHNSLSLIIYRLDFKAIVKLPNEKQKTILIEIQKSKQSANILRFRRYLAENYRKEEAIMKNGKLEKTILPIVTIYFLGFNLEQITAPIIKIQKNIIDMATNTAIDPQPKEDFIDLLTHESYTIQVLRLNGNYKSRIEQVLDVFSQRFITTDNQRFQYNVNLNDPLWKKITKRLNRVVSDEQMQKNMDIEDEMEQTVFRELQTMADDLSEARKERDEAQKQNEEAQRQKNEAQKQNEEAQKQKEEAVRELEELKKRFGL